jgi:uncharacterized protein YjbJ (UPF0337 family)
MRRPNSFASTAPQCRLNRIPLSSDLRLLLPFKSYGLDRLVAFYFPSEQIMSTQEKLRGNWNQLKGKVKQQWGQLTDDEINQIEGNFDQLVGLVQRKTGEARQQIERTLNELNDQTSGVAAAVSEKAREYADQAGEKLRGAAGQIRERTQDYAEEAEAMIRSRPAESVAVAFGAGLTLGLLVAMASRSRD